jgi:DNA-binding MarR family transcriptional regulator
VETELLIEDLLTLWRLVQRASHPVRRGEMTPKQYWLLRAVNRHGPISIGDLAGHRQLRDHGLQAVGETGLAGARAADG